MNCMNHGPERHLEPSLSSARRGSLRLAILSAVLFALTVTPASAIPFVDANGIVQGRELAGNRALAGNRTVVIGNRPLRGQPDTLVQDRALADRSVLPPPVTVVPPLVLDTAPALVLPAPADPLGASEPPLHATPEPATLLLFGTTAAGLGLARWRQRRRKQP